MFFWGGLGDLVNLICNYFKRLLILFFLTLEKFRVLIVELIQMSNFVEILLLSIYVIVMGWPMIL